MIHWMDSFMALFGYKRPEVWEAERKEHDVTFPAPQAFPADMKPPPGYKFKEPRKKSNVRSKKSNVRSKRAGKHIAAIHDDSTESQIQTIQEPTLTMKEIIDALWEADRKRANVRSKRAGKRSQSAEGRNEK